MSVSPEGFTSGAEYSPVDSLEGRVLAQLGYAHVLGKPIPQYTHVLSENFLDAYPSPERAQSTRDELEALESLDRTDPDYAALESRVLTYFEVIFGPPATQG